MRIKINFPIKEYMKATFAHIILNGEILKGFSKTGNDTGCSQKSRTFKQENKI